jgi:hypothetical protein
MGRAFTVDKAEFLNALKSLFNIDSYLLPELTHFQGSEFHTDPVRYFLRCDDEKQDAIWREVSKRQVVAALDKEIDDMKEWNRQEFGL